MAAIPAPVSFAVSNDGTGGETPFRALINSEINSRLMSEIIDYFSVNIHRRVRPDVFSNLCISLSRCIDFAMAHHEIPNRYLELPSLLKKVCFWKNDTHLQAAIMVLMISIKNVCQHGWFSDRDSEELRNLAKEIAGNFYSTSNFNSEPTCSILAITAIMSRFYPRMKMGQMFVFLEVKPGFDAYVSDFQLSKNLKFSPGDKIRLFVVQRDSIETSSCLISPSKVNFLVNGVGVEGRTNLYMDTGPQIPTELTHLLKYGLNILQAVGEFNGNYIIAVASMSEMPNAYKNALQDYEQHDSPIVDSDSDIIEEASRISLNCPISFRRIKTPVKGQSCRHIQCFDFDNYVDINSRRPSWRCPHCNQHVCFTDIRIDQKMVKIFEEVGTNVNSIIVSSDGSWNAVMEIDGATVNPEDGTCNSGLNESPHPESVGLLNVHADILDLTKEDGPMDVVATHKTEDRKLSPNDCRSQSLMQTMAVNPHLTNTNDMNQSIAGAEDDSWSRIFLSTFGLRSPNVTPDTQNPASFVSNSNQIAAPVLNYTVSAPNRERDACDGQSPPAWESTSVLQQMSRNSVNTFMHNGLSAAHQASPAAPLNQYPVMQQNGSSVSVRPARQNVEASASVRPTHQNVAHGPPNQIPNGHGGVNERQSSSQQTMNLRMPRALNPSPGPIRSSFQSPTTRFLRPQNHAGVSQDGIGLTAGVSGQQVDLITAANRAMHMALDEPSSRMNLNNRSLPSAGHHEVTTSVGPQPVIRMTINPADQNWRPAGRMRGALSGQAFTNAFNEFIVRPNLLAQAARSMPNMTSIPINVPPLIQPIAAERVGQNPSRPYHPSAGLASETRVSGFMPD